LIKEFDVYDLRSCVSGINNTGFEYDDFCYTLSYMRSFISKELAEQFIETTLDDYVKRNIGTESKLLHFYN
jgi:hypothetical protein